MPFILIIHRINTIVSMKTMFELSFSENKVNYIVNNLLPQHYWKMWVVIYLLSDIFYINRCMAAKNKYGEIWFCLSSIKILSKTISIISNVKGIVKLDQICIQIIQSQFDCQCLFYILRPFLTNGFWTCLTVNHCYTSS